MRWPWKKPGSATRRHHFCAVGGCGNTATHDRLIDTPVWVAGEYLYAWLCDDCDRSPMVDTPMGLWQALDEVTPEQLDEDRQFLPGRPSPYANNLVLPSGRAWRFRER